MSLSASALAQSADEKAKVKDKYSEKELQEMQGNATISKAEAKKVRRASDAKNDNGQGAATKTANGTKTFGGAREEPLVPEDEKARRTMEQVREARKAIEKGEKSYTPPSSEKAKPNQSSSKSTVGKSAEAKSQAKGQSKSKAKASAMSASAPRSYTANEVLTKKLVTQNEQAVIARARAMSALKRINADLKAGNITQEEYDGKHSIIKRVNQKADELEQHIRDTRLRLASNQ